MTGVGAMRRSVSRSSGRADPFGLLVLAVALALTVTIGIQARASAPDGWTDLRTEVVCTAPCVSPEQSR